MKYVVKKVNRGDCNEEFVWKEKSKTGFHADQKVECEECGDRVPNQRHLELMRAMYVMNAWKVDFLKAKY